MTDYDPSTNTYADHFAEGGTASLAAVGRHVGARRRGAPEREAPADAARERERRPVPRGLDDAERVLRRHRGSEPAAGHAGMGLPDRPRHAEPRQHHQGGRRRQHEGALEREAARERPDADPGGRPQLRLPGHVHRSERRCVEPARLGTAARHAPRRRGAVERRQGRAGGADRRELHADRATGWTGADWIMYWTQPDDGVAPPATYTHDYYAVAASVDALGNVTYTDGTIAFDDSGDEQYSSVNGAQRDGELRRRPERPDRDRRAARRRRARLRHPDGHGRRSHRRGEPGDGPHQRRHGHGPTARGRSARPAVWAELR